MKMDGKRGLPPGRARHGRLGAEVARRRPASRADDIALVVPHQANIRIIDAACQRLGIADGPDRDGARTAPGNTSSASIPLALVDADRRRPRRTTATSCCSSASAPA